MSDDKPSNYDDHGAEEATLRARLATAEGLLQRSAKVMREWTGYDVWRPLHDEINAFLAPTPPKP